MSQRPSAAQRKCGDGSAACGANEHAAVAVPVPPSFYELRRYVRSPGLEGPSVIPVADYHADANPLVQMLRKGHHGVQLDDEAWDRLVTWIDMNAPAYGTWLEIPTVRYRHQYVQQPTDFFSNWLRPSLN